MTKKKDKAPAPVVVDELDALAAELGVDASELAADVAAEADAEIKEVLVPIKDGEPDVAEQAQENAIDVLEQDEKGNTLVKDAKGQVAFKRLKPTRPDPGAAKPRTKAPTKMRDRLKPMRPSAKANPAQLVFPSDRWGLTKDLKKAVTVLASRIAGDAGKKALVDETLATLLEHLDAKFKRDHAFRESQAPKTE